jgi:hypothetical protein
VAKSEDLDSRKKWDWNKMWILISWIDYVLAHICTGAIIFTAVKQKAPMMAKTMMMLKKMRK